MSGPASRLFLGRRHTGGKLTQLCSSSPLLFASRTQRLGTSSEGQTTPPSGPWCQWRRPDATQKNGRSHLNCPGCRAISKRVDRPRHHRVTMASRQRPLSLGMIPLSPVIRCTSHLSWSPPLRCFGRTSHSVAGFARPLRVKTAARETDPLVPSPFAPHSPSTTLPPSPSSSRLDCSPRLDLACLLSPSDLA